MNSFRLVQILKSVLFFAAIFAAGIIFSCKQMTDSVGAPHIAGANSGVGSTLSAPRDVVATNGLKKMVYLSWPDVASAKSYSVYAATNPTKEFNILKDGIRTNSFSDNVSAGVTKYYKVMAVAADGRQSVFSPVVKGTSLATPVLSDCNQGENSITLYWYMENARDVKTNANNYESDLEFKITCQKKGEDTVLERTCSGGTYQCTFNNLDGSADYYCQVFAYLASTPDSTEYSDRVSLSTLKSYIPNAPEFTATEGTSAKSITLEITLPSQVFVSTGTTAAPNEKSDVPYPVCFKIERKLESQPDSAYNVVCETLYYNGSTTKPNSYSYVQGNKITWVDDDANFVRGEKYQYRINSYVDTNYSDKMGYAYKDSKCSTKASTATGWVCAAPVFDVENIEPHTTDGLNNDTVTFNFNAAWNALGKEADYKFAIKENHRKLGKENLAGTDTVRVYESIAEVNSASAAKTIDLKNDDSLQGTYRYTLYIVPKDYAISSAAIPAEYVLDSIEAGTMVLAIKEIDNTKSEILKITDGYKDKVEIQFTCENNVSYTLERTGGTAGTVTKNIDVSSALGSPTFTYTDTGLESGVEYSYILYAKKNTGIITVPSTKCTARTLGTPAPVFDFEKLAYDSVTVRFAKVLAANKYTLTLGTAGDFGGGKNIVISVDEEGDVASVSAPDMAVAPTVEFAGNEYTVTINKPYGYDDATLAGRTATLTVEAASAVGASASGTCSVNVIGPAGIGLEAGEVEASAIKISWKQVSNAKGYAVFRTNVTDNNTDVFYVDATSKAVTCNDENVGNAVKVEFKNDKFYLTDNQTTVGGDAFTWKIYQARLAWGEEYSYTVLPVLNSDDAKESMLTKYKNPNKVVSYTYGYGLNVTATKAEYAEKIKITWTVPPYAQKNSAIPKLCYRVKADEAANTQTVLVAKQLTTGVNVSGSNATYEFVPETANRVDILEFFVTYNPVSGSEKKFENSYLASFRDANKKDANGEYTNQGYMFTMPTDGWTLKDLIAEETFEEKIMWPLYGTERKVVPEYYTLEIKNLNNSAGWKEVATYKNGTFTTPSVDWYSVNITNNKAGDLVTTTVKPTDIGTATTRLKRNNGTATAYAGTHNGLLKVQRDYKHYYRVVAHRGTLEAVLGGGDEDYTYRKITDDEFVKGITLIVADALFQMGIPGNTKTDWRVGSDSLGYFYSSYPTGTDRKFEWGTKGRDYTHTYPAGLIGDTSSFTSAWTINMPQASGTYAVEGVVNNGQLFRLPWGTIKVTHSSGLSSYQGYVVLSAGDYTTTKKWGVTTYSTDTYWRASIQYNHTPNTAPNGDGIVINESGSNNTKYDEKADMYYTVKDNQDKFLTWFPYDIGTKHPSGDASINASFPTYKGTWWQAR